jgi:hypothetical protein
MKYVSAQELEKAVKRLISDGTLPGNPKAQGGYPSTKSSILRRLKKDNVQPHEVPAKGGKNGVSYEYQLSAIPRLPAPVREAFGTEASRAAKAGAHAAKEHKEQVQRTADEEAAHKERCLTQFASLPVDRQQEAYAKLAVLNACASFLKGGGFVGRIKEGTKTWNKKGLKLFIAKVKSDSTLLEEKVYAELTRCGQVSLGYKTLLSWRDRYAVDGMYGLANHYVSKMATSVPEPMQKFLIAFICDHPHASSKKLLSGVEARFCGEELPSIYAINGFVRKWKEKNAEKYLFLTNPDEWKNKFMFAVGDASEAIVALNQRWEADSTPGDIMLTDGRHTIICVIDVFPRRARFLVSKTSKSGAIAALLRRCLLEWGVPDVLKSDNGQDYVALYLVAIYAALEIDHQRCRPFSPEEKPHVERVLQTMSHGIVELLPGYIGHNVPERKAIEARKSFASKLMSKGETVEVSLSSVELQKMLDRWTDAMYMQDPHSGLDGKTPAQVVQAWNQPTRKISDPHALDALLIPAVGRGGFRIIGKEGIKLVYGAAELEYWAEEFAGRSGERVRVCPDLADLGHALIYLESGEFLCWATDPSWYGISRAEAGNHLRNKQRKIMTEGVKELKKLAKEQRTRGISEEILVHRERELAERTANVVEMPKRSVEHTTPALEQAAIAADVRKNGRPLPAPRVSPEVEAMKAKMRAEEEKDKAHNVRSIQVASGKVHYARMMALQDKLDCGVDISTEEYDILRRYKMTNEYKAYKGMEEEALKAIK